MLYTIILCLCDKRMAMWALCMRVYHCVTCVCVCVCVCVCECVCVCVCVCM